MTSRFSKQGTLAVVCLATAMLMLDIAVVNTALSHIAADLHSSVTGLQWIVVAVAQTSDVIVKIAMPQAKTRRRPTRSATDPAVRTTVASASV